MARCWGRAIACILLISVLLARSSTAECSFEYRRQPPSTTKHGCTPYNNDDRIVIALECVVRRIDDISTTFKIRWFGENTTGVVEDLGLGDPVVQLGTRDRLSRYHDIAFINQAYSPSLLGKYWCQVINTTADPDQPLMRSNVFTLLAPGDYSGPKCMEITTIQEETNITCADLPGNQPVQLTTVLTTQLQTLTSTAVAVSSYHTTHLLISSTPTELIPSTIAATATITATTATTTTTTITSLLVSATDVIVYTVAGVLVILCCSMILVILIMMRRRKTVGQATAAGHDNNTVELDDDHHEDTQLQLKESVTNKESHVLLSPTAKGTVPASPSKNEELPAALHCSSTSYDAVQYSPVAHYQPLHTVTTDYTSVYTTPTGRRGPPSVEVEGKMYSIVDTIKRETDTNYDTVVTEPYYM